jgi:hypothetical protein
MYKSSNSYEIYQSLLKFTKIDIGYRARLRTAVPHTEISADPLP